MKISRRKLAAAVLGSSAAAMAQTQPAATTSPDAELAAARDRLRANIAAIGSQNVPMAVEPAFQFKA
jgi:hypothetical protein